MHTTTTGIDDTELSSSRSVFLIAISAITAIFYLAAVWLYTANTPDSDDHIVSLFSILRFIQADNWHDKLSAITWTYMQHRGIYGKIIYLIDYYLTGKQNFHMQAMAGNLALCATVVLIAQSIIRHRMPLYCIPICCFLIFNFYAWTVFTWPGGSLWYYGTIMWAMACFCAIDARKPNILLACICSWLSAYTFANGILTIPVASLLLLYNQHQNRQQSNHPQTRRYTNKQIALWFGSALAGCIVYVSTINLFSTDLYGAKTLAQSFDNIPGRLLDFVESVGAVPFPAGGERSGKIILGIVILVGISTVLATGKFMVSPAIAAFWAFNIITLLLTSLFRYSAGGNPGYQIFTSINLALLLITATSIWRPKTGSRIPVLLLMLAIAIHLQGIHLNLGKIQQNRRQSDEWLAQAVARQDFSPEEWKGGIVIDAIEAGIYAPDFLKDLPMPDAEHKTRADLYKRTCNGLKKQFFVKAAGPLFDTYCKKQSQTSKKPSL